MVSHPDAVVNRALRKLEGVASLDQYSSISVTEGTGTTKQMAHALVTFTASFSFPSLKIKPFGVDPGAGGAEVGMTKTVELYFSRSGVALLQLTETLSLSGTSNVIILAEVENPDSHDLTSGRVFQVVRRTGYEAGQFRSETQALTPILANILGVTRRDYDDLVVEVFKGTGALNFFGANDISMALTTRLVDTLKPPIEAFAKVLWQWRP